MSTTVTYPNWVHGMVSAAFFQQMSAIFADVTPTTPSGEEGVRSVSGFYLNDHLIEVVKIGTINMGERGVFDVSVLMDNSVGTYLKVRPDEPAQIFCADVVLSFGCPLGSKMEVSDEELAQLPVVLLPLPTAAVDS